jgi:hypothetical protein
MDIIHARFAGRDVHKQTVVACVRVAAASTARHEVRTFASRGGGLYAHRRRLHAARRARLSRSRGCSLPAYDHASLVAALTRRLHHLG